MVHHEFPEFSVPERIADGIVHVLSIGAAIAGIAVLLLIATGSLPANSVLSLSVYSVGLVAVFSFSAAYHLTRASPAKALLARFDQASIYFKIASTYTPFVLVKMAAWPGSALLAMIWSVATFGMTAKLFFPNRLIRTSYVLYLALGWSALFILSPLVASVSARTLALLGIGGILYTVGVVFHLWPGLRFRNAIWHGFVLCGSACHYFAVVDTVMLA